MKIINAAILALTLSPGALAYENIFDAAAAGDLEAVMSFVEDSDEDEESDAEGRTALYLAAAGGHLHVVRYLASASGSSVDSRDARGWAAVNIASSNGFVEVVRFLLEEAGAIDEVLENGDTSFHLAASHGRLSVVAYLFRRNSHLIHAANHAGETALHRAVQYGHLTVAQFLMVMGANIGAIDFHDHTPLHIAARYRRVALMNFLIQAGARVDANVFRLFLRDREFYGNPTFRNALRDLTQRFFHAAFPTDNPSRRWVEQQIIASLGEDEYRRLVAPAEFGQFLEFSDEVVTRSAIPDAVSRDIILGYLGGEADYVPPPIIQVPRMADVRDSIWNLVYGLTVFRVTAASILFFQYLGSLPSSVSKLDKQLL